MKSVLRLTFLFVAIAALSSCSKVIVEVQPAITGSWVLTDAAHKDSYGWYTVNTGIENGVFTFYSNGRARYVENGTTLEGTWNIQTLTNGYYDEYGNYYTNSHQAMSIHVSNYYGDDTIDMYFDNVKVYSNSFVGTNYNNNYIGRYRFSRY
ncbi:hypothetical protein FAM09_19365 [Niastella caeni]|uniref:Lipocalin-like domain-containing protein n=1 Tax=Niastella caeni TaxID=2569763 RepID=A0A4S8HVE3_9BACT|nr:hypothetical protein [Niastella caeni]THU37112.1 hypothetical protein FAM09_19365 [Niastella caeni]